MTRSAVVLAVVGVLLLAAAAVVRFAVLPSVNKLGSGFSTTMDYSGTYRGLNPAALATGASTGLLVAGAPATASRAYATTSVEGDTAVVAQTVRSTVGGQALPTAGNSYAVDRVHFGSVPAPAGVSGVTPSQGQIFTLPQHPSTSATYQLWDQTTAAAYPLRYATTATVAGRSAYEYRTTERGRVADPASLGLPTSLPKSRVLGLATALSGQLPAGAVAQLPSVLQLLPDTIPLTYTSTNAISFFADTTLGSPLRIVSNQQITVQLGGIAALQVPFSTLTVTTTAASSQSLADDTASTVSSLTLVGTTIPVVLAVLGVLALVAALLLARRAGQQPAAPRAKADEPTPTRV